VNEIFFTSGAASRVSEICADAAPEDVEATIRQPGFLHQPADRDRRGRGFSRSLEDDSAAACQRRHDLAERLAEGEVPGGEGDADADRFARDELLHARIAGGDGPAVDAACLFRVPVGMVGGKVDLADCLGQRLSLVTRYVAADLVGMVASEVGEAAQDLAALERRTVFQLSKARCADETADARSASVACGKWPMIWPVAGSSTSSRFSVS
jgi:hypothetical protein